MHHLWLKASSLVFNSFSHLPFPACGLPLASPMPSSPKRSLHLSLMQATALLALGVPPIVLPDSTWFKNLLLYLYIYIYLHLNYLLVCILVCKQTLDVYIYILYIFMYTYIVATKRAIMRVRMFSLNVPGKRLHPSWFNIWISTFDSTSNRFNTIAKLQVTKATSMWFCCTSCPQPPRTGL